MEIFGRPLPALASQILIPHLHDLLQKLGARGGRNPRALVLTPTRELAAQVAQSITDYGKYLDTLDLGVISRQEWPLAYSSCTAGVKVDLPRGAVLRAAGA